jgi:hypothetical protein
MNQYPSRVRSNRNLFYGKLAKKDRAPLSKIVLRGIGKNKKNKKIKIRKK